MTELATIFHRYGSAYREKYGQRMPISHQEAMWAIEHCRTETLGGHVFYCEPCDETQYSYHSCQNRHCPKCQNQAGQQWLRRQQNLLLGVPYFMLTFTLPAGLHPIVRSHQKRLYNLLFRTSAAATQKLACDERFLGGQIGLVGVLHTWARDLTYHPHVHYLMPAGALSPDGQRWLPSGEQFLLPVKALSAIFRAKFRDALRKTGLFDLVPAEVWQAEWVVHCQSVGNGAAALKYLAPYIFRVAISNRRLVSLKHNKVTFRYQDSKTRETKYCTLSAETFIQRFLQHVLPKGFMKVRYYGFFSSGNRQRLKQVKALVGSADLPVTEEEPQLEVNATDAQTCPKCGQVMQLVQKLKATGRCPP